MANSHEELVTELPKLEKMSNVARLKLAKKRRMKQLKRNQELTRRERETGQYVSHTRSNTKINFINEALLHEAVCRNDRSEVEILLKEGVCSNPSNADGLTPLHRCCIENTVEMAKLLLDYGAERDARDVEGWTPLHAASACGNLTMINLLIEEGASMTALNHDDKMPVDVACDGDIRYVIQQKMLEAGYTDDVCKFMRSSIPTTLLADLKDSVKNGRSLNLQDKYGATALHVAAANGYIEVLKFLLQESSININIQDNEGWTPFHAAVCWEQREAMCLLAKHGGNMEIEDIHGDTPFAVSDNPDIRQYIIELKADFTEPTHESLTLPKMEQLRASMEDLSTGGMDERGRRRSLSARRSSVQARDEMKKKTAQLEKKMMNQLMNNDDMERDISGEILSTGDDIPLSPVNKSITDDSSVRVIESPIDKDDDGVLRDVEKGLDGDVKNDRRRKLKSVLKSKTPTPVINIDDDNNDHQLTKADSFRLKHTETDNARNCCVIL